MGRRKAKLSTLSIFRWFCNNMAIVLGIIPQSRRSRRILTKRCNRKVNVTLSNRSIKKYLREKSSPIKERNMCQDTNARTNTEFKNVGRLFEPSELSILNNNNNRNFDNVAYGDTNVNRLSDVEQRRILCILVENPKRAECIQNLLAKHATIFKDSRIIDLQELVQFIQSTITTNRTHGDASTMTSADQMCQQTTSCTSFIAQSENERRLKALEFIRIFIEKNEEDFCEYLINEEHLCQPKTLAIYQMIKQFLKVVYQAEHGQIQKAS